MNKRNAADIRISRVRLVLTLAFLSCVSASPSFGNNGSVAIAFEASDIKVDGDFSDWPAGLPTYPVRRVVGGDTLRGPSDLNAEFRVAYDAKSETLFVAVEVQDDSIQVASKHECDNVVISIGTKHCSNGANDGAGDVGDIGESVFHFDSGKRSNAKSDSCAVLDVSTQRYEFAMRLNRFGPGFKPPDQPFTCSFTVEIHDRDADGTQSLIAWSREPFKMLGVERHGDIIINATRSKSTVVAGKPKPGTESFCGHTKVRLKSTTNPKLVADVFSDERGGYLVTLPHGNYTREFPDQPSIPSRSIATGSEDPFVDSIDYGLVKRSTFPLAVSDDFEFRRGVSTPLSRLPHRQRLRFTQKSGIPRSLVRGFAQTNDGVLWLAAEKGLYSVSGTRIRRYAVRPSSDPRFQGRCVATIQRGEKEEVWYGDKHGLLIVDAQEDSVKFEERLSGQEVHVVAVGHDQQVMVGTSRGLFVQQEGRLVAIPLPEECSTEVVQALCASPDDKFTYVGTADGLFRYDGTRFTHIPFQPDQDCRICSLLVDSRGRLWMGTGTSLLAMDGDSVVTIWEQDAERYRYVRSIVESDGEVVAAAHDGFIKTSLTDLSQVRHIDQRNLLTAFVDRDQNLWFTSELGSFLTCDISTTTLHDARPCDLIDEHDGDLWYTFLTRPGRWHLAKQGDRRNSRLAPGKPHLLSASDQGVLLGQSDGLFRVEGDDIVQHPAPELAGKKILDISVDQDGYPWVTTEDNGGVFRLEGDEVECMASELPIGNETYAWILHQSDGSTVVGSHHSIWFFKDGVTKRRLTSSDGLEGMVTCVAPDPNGAIWIATTEGLFLFRDGALTRRETADELEQGYAGALSTGGHYWTAYRLGVRKSPQYEKLLFHAPRLALVRNCVSSKDISWQTTSRGLFSIRKPTNAPPTLDLHRITHAGSKNESKLSRSVCMTTDDKLLRFEYDTKSAVVPTNDIVYRHRLKGYEQDWQRSRDRLVEYADLPRGNYVFEVEAIASDLQKSTTLSVPVKVSLPFGRHALMIGLMLSLMGFVATGITSLAKSQEQNAKLEDRVAEGVKKEVELREQLRNAQRLESLGTLAAGVSHDFNNSLQAISLSTELAMLEDDPVKTRELLSDIGLAANQAADLTRALLMFGKQESTRREPTPIGDALSNSVRMIRRITPQNINVTLDATNATDLWCDIDSSQIQQAIVNLCINSRDAMPKGGEIQIFSTTMNESSALIRVTDNGCGIENEKLSLVFDPFFTDKPREQGTGLGLSIAHGIVTAHGGQIRIDSEVGKGTVVEIELPTCEPESEEWLTPEIPATEENELILVAEDQAPVRSTIRKLLKNSGYRVIEANNGLQALETVRRRRDELHSVILDVDMPGLNGMEVMESIREEGFDGRVVIMTGLPSSVTSLDGNACLLDKPFNANEAIRAIRNTNA